MNFEKIFNCLYGVLLTVIILFILHATVYVFIDIKKELSIIHTSQLIQTECYKVLINQ